MEASAYNPKTIRQLYNIFRRGVEDQSDGYRFDYNLVTADLYVKVRKYRYWHGECSRYLHDRPRFEERKCALIGFYYDLNHE